MTDKSHFYILAFFNQSRKRSDLKLQHFSVGSPTTCLDGDVDRLCFSLSEGFVCTFKAGQLVLQRQLHPNVHVAAVTPLQGKVTLVFTD